MMHIRAKNINKGNVMALSFGRLNRTVVSVEILNPENPSHTQFVEITSVDAKGIEYVGRFRADEILYLAD